MAMAYSFGVITFIIIIIILIIIIRRRRRRRRKLRESRMEGVVEEQKW